MKSPQRRMRLRRWRFRGSKRPSQLLLPKSCGHVGSVSSLVVVVAIEMRSKGMGIDREKGRSERSEI